MHPAVAFVLTTASMLVLVELVGLYTRREPQTAWKTLVSRKLLHVLCGLIFLLHWHLFAPEHAALAACIPALMTLKFAAVGVGLLPDKHTVHMMSRSGNPRELLLGPSLYGVVAAVVTYFLFQTTSAAIVLACLCGGDGAAELAGRAMKHGPRLFWNKGKSVAGCLGFLIASVAVGVGVLHYAHAAGWPPQTHVAGAVLGLDTTVLVRLVIAAFVAMLVESLPIPHVDNVTVAAAAAATDLYLLQHPDTVVGLAVAMRAILV